MSLEDKLNQVKGSVKEGLGKVTGDKKTEAEGVAEKVASKAKEVAEDVLKLLYFLPSRLTVEDRVVFCLSLI